MEDETLTCSAVDRESVIGPALSILQDEFLSNCSKTVDSGIVCEICIIHFDVSV